MLVTVTGRRSGRPISTPTNYLREANTLWVISWRERRWWRNLRGGAKLQVLLAGRSLEASGDVIEDETQVAHSLYAYYCRVPGLARYVQISVDAQGKPLPSDCAVAAKKLVMVKIDL